jgi:integrase
MRTTLSLRAEADKSGKHIVYLRYSYGSQFHPFSFGVKIEKKYWNQYDLDIVPECPDYSNIMRLKIQKEEEIQGYIKKCFANNEAPTKDNVYKYFKASKGVLEDNPGSGYVILEKYIKHKEDSGYRALASLKTVERSIKRKSGAGFCLTDITPEWVHNYVEGLYSGKYSTLRKRTGLSNASIKLYLMQISTALRWAKKEGYKVPADFVDMLKFNHKVVNKDKHILTKDEIQKIIKYDGPMLLPMNKFKFCLFTSLRISDVNSLKWEHIDMDKRILYKITRKSTKGVAIGLNDFAYDVLAGLDKSSEYVFAKGHRLNRNIKAAFKEMGMDRSVIVGHMVKNQYVETTKKLYEVVSSHYARHNYGYYFLDAEDNDLFALQKIFGHANMNTTMRYAKINESKLISSQRKMFSALRQE